MFKQIAAVLSVLLLFFMVCSHCHSSLFMRDIGYSDDLLEFTHVALHMAKTFITRRTNTLVIMERCEFLCEEHRKYHVALLQNFIHNLNYTLNIQLFLGKPDERPWDYNLFIIDSWWAFELSVRNTNVVLLKLRLIMHDFRNFLIYRALRFHFPITIHERQFNFYILLNLPHVIQHTVEEHMLRIFNMCLRYNVKNVVIMYRNPGARYISFYTYQIFGPDHCHERTTIKEVNRYENGRLQNNFLFPDHMSNFHGCTLTVCGHIVQPLLAFYGNIANRKHLMEMERLGGTEGDILKLVARTLNIKFKFIFPRELNMIQLYSNSTGCFGELEKRHAHIAIGSLSPSFTNSFKFSYSYAYHTSPYVFVVRGGMLFGPVKQLLNPLNYDTWLVVVTCLIIISVLIYIIEHYQVPTLRNFIFGRDNTQPLRNMLVVLLGNPTPWYIVPKRNFARFLFIAWIFFTFELRNGYQGKMFDSLRLAKRLPIPRKISELIERDYTLLTAIYPNFYPMNKTQLMRNSTDRMNLINSSENRLTTTELLDYLVSFNTHNVNTSFLTYIEENVYFYQCVAFFNKHSIIVPSFDRKFKLLSDAGITGYISQRHVRRHLQNMKGRTKSPPVAQITNRNLRGLYTIYGVLCQTSIYVFILELLTTKSRKLKRLMDWLN